MPFIDYITKKLWKGPNSNDAMYAFHVPPQHISYQLERLPIAMLCTTDTNDRKGSDRMSSTR